MVAPGSWSVVGVALVSLACAQVPRTSIPWSEADFCLRAEQLFRTGCASSPGAPLDGELESTFDANNRMWLGEGRLLGTGFIGEWPGLWEIVGRGNYVTVYVSLRIEAEHSGGDAYVIFDRGDPSRAVVLCGR